jgi:hypothetical protein
LIRNVSVSDVVQSDDGRYRLGLAAAVLAARWPHNLQHL